MHGLEKEFGDRIHFVRVNVLNPESGPMLDLYGFNATPEFYLVDQRGEIVAFWSEFFTEDGLRQTFEALLASQ